MRIALLQMNSRSGEREQARNAAERTVHWHFTTADARIKLKKLYPKVLP